MIAILGVAISLVLSIAAPFVFDWLGGQRESAGWSIKTLTHISSTYGVIARIFENGGLLVFFITLLLRQGARRE
ncbi:MAG TPA: hypothetical protein VFE58_13395 [Tepidisphaeraceae bacterium]|nr:hypothetical protein [Tepidisphaeraceae bacterium]